MSSTKIKYQRLKNKNTSGLIRGLIGQELLNVVFVKNINMQLPVRKPLAQRENLPEEALDSKDKNIEMDGNLAGASTPPGNKRQGLHFDSVAANAEAVLHALSQEVSLA